MAQKHHSPCIKAIMQYHQLHQKCPTLRLDAILLFNFLPCRVIKKVSLLIKRSVCVDCARSYFEILADMRVTASCVDTVGPACTFIICPQIASKIF